LTRRIITVILNEAICDPDINLNNLTGYGRIDVVCRIISSCFFLSNGFRRDTELRLLFKKCSKLLNIDGRVVKGINVDERAIAGVLKRIFGGKLYAGITFTSIDWNAYISGLKGISLVEDGPEKGLDLLDCYEFILGDQKGYEPGDLDLINHNSKINPLSLGSKSYLASDTITILHYIIDALTSDSRV